MIAGSVTLTPDDPALPTYSGSYREKVNGVLIGVDEDGNDVDPGRAVPPAQHAARHRRLDASTCDCRAR